MEAAKLGEESPPLSCDGVADHSAPRRLMHKVGPCPVLIQQHQPSSWRQGPDCRLGEGKAAREEAPPLASSGPKTSEVLTS